MAKALDPNPDTDPSQSPTLTAAATQMGVIMGTAAYMSPEQAAGQIADKRSDIWSFGVVLFEVLTGQRLFTGETVSHVLAKVLDRELDLSALPTPTPVSIKRLLRRCLERKPKRRLSDLGEALSHLEDALAPVDEALSAVPSVSPVVQPAGWRQALPLALVMSVVVAVVTGLGVWSLTPRADPGLTRAVARFSLSTEQLYLSANSADVAMSENGHIVYPTLNDGNSGLGMRLLHQLSPITVVAGRGAVTTPFFSPDGEWIGYMDTAGPTLRRVRVTGGPSLTIGQLPAFVAGASWGTDNTIVFATLDVDQGLWQVSVDGGEPEPLTAPDHAQGEANHLWPEILPGNEAVLFTVTGNTVEDHVIAVLSLATGTYEFIIQGGTGARYVPTGHVVYGLADTLQAVPFDLASLVVTGDPVTVAEDVMIKPTGVANFTVSDNGSLVYVPSNELSDTPVQQRLGWVNRGGEMTAVIDAEALWRVPRLSPDGTRVAASRGGERAGELVETWLLDLERGGETQLTSSGGASGLWSPDGMTVTFTSGGGGSFDLFLRRADFSGEADVLLAAPEALSPQSWSPDGQTLVFGKNVGNQWDLSTLSPGGDPVPFLETEASEGMASISPNGEWLAYVSEQAGEPRVYVQAFPQGGSRIPISTGQGNVPVWSRDGEELFFRNGNQMMAVSVDPGPPFTAGAPRVLFEGPYLPWFDVSLDGQEFLMVETSETEETSPLVLVQNWFKELTRLVPVD